MDIPSRVGTLFPSPADIPEAHRLPSRVDQDEYLIGGEIRRWSGPRAEVASPIFLHSGGGLQRAGIGSFPLMTAKESLEALDAAQRAYDDGRGQWPTMSTADRIEALLELTRRMKEKREEIVRLLMWEICKTLKDSEKEFDRTIEYMVATIDALKDLDRVSSRFVIDTGVVGQIRRAPLGVVLCMGPYNYPLNETFTTLIPALIMGNCVIFKPAKMGVLLLRPLLEAFRDCFPAGVVNTIYGDGAQVVGPLMTSGGIDCLAFIGSTSVSDHLKSQHPNPHRLRSILGLGAKNAAIILPDADIDLAVSECVLGSLSYNGQRCTAIKIVFVHRSIHGELMNRFVRAVDSLRFGMPWEQDVMLTPLPDPGKPASLKEWVDEAVAAGAEIVNDGGGTICESYFHAAVVDGVKPGMKLYSKEQFGPVVPVVPFDRIEEPVRWVSDSPYGQQVSIFGNDSATIGRLIDPLVNQVCRVNLNSQCQRGPDTFPFTGRRDSAEGTLSVSDALRVFSIRTLVAAKSTDANRRILTKIVREHQSKFLSTDFIL